MWYAFDNATGNSVSLKTRIKAEAVQKVNAMNETERQPSINLGLAKVYLNASDPKLATRTWQDVMENIITKKTDDGRLLKHLYYYFGYDVQPTCDPDLLQ